MNAILLNLTALIVNQINFIKTKKTNKKIQ